MRNYSCDKCVHKGEKDGRCGMCLSDVDWKTGHRSKPTYYEERIATEAALPRNDSEKVNHPQHYNHGKYECIEVMVENFGKEAVKHFCLLNAFKYVWRSDYKNGIEDVKKAMFYLDYYLKLEGETNE